MDVLGIAIRCLIAYLFLLGMLRLAGKRTIQEGTPFDLILAMILGDLVDDPILGDVPVAQFLTAAATLVLAELALTLYKRRVRA
jgi:uncharacterized membrane protein YcaP (DUF421 family)